MVKKLFVCFAILLISACGTINQENRTNNMKTSNRQQIRIDTFDSGFGGYFTAKAIEKSAREIVKTKDTAFTVHHFGDTQFAPYGEKTPEQIAELTAYGVKRALSKGSDTVFIACNTASTQYPAVVQAVEAEFPGRGKDVISIIQSSAEEVKEKLDAALVNKNEAHFTIFATPATTKTEIYPKTIAQLYGAELIREKPLAPAGEALNGLQNFIGKSSLKLDNGKKIHLYSFAPAEWVGLIEGGADLKTKHSAVNRDLALLETILPPKQKIDGVGEFCTHYPVFDRLIRARFAEQNLTDNHTAYIVQAPLMAEIFEKRAAEKLSAHNRLTPADEPELRRLYEMSRPTITISGDNRAQTEALARTVFPDDPAPIIKTETRAEEPALKRKRVN